MQLLSQPFDSQLGDYLTQTLQSGKYDTCSVAVAFAKNSGVLRLRDSLMKFRKNGGDIHFYVGVDMNGTSYEALSNLREISTSLHVIHDSSGQTFHTKLYSFSTGEESEITVGSNNLTGGGLWTNYESSLQLRLDHRNVDHMRIKKQVDDYLEHLRQLSGRALLIDDDSIIQRLLDEKYVEKEVLTQVRRRNTASSTQRQGDLFGAGPRNTIPKLPEYDQPTPSTGTRGVDSIRRNRPKSSESKATDPTLWLETRKMTGGSRNILDLSKRSLLKRGTVAGTRYEHTDPKYMQGAVEFFDMDPDETSRTKQIVINYEGTDYAGNEIKYPGGPKANGTWRIQIKGVSPEGTPITSAFRTAADGGYLLPGKIVTFTRIKTDYYYLSVCADSELSRFEAASKVTAYNGSTTKARHLGIL